MRIIEPSCFSAAIVSRIPTACEIVENRDKSRLGFAVPIENVRSVCEFVTGDLEKFISYRTLNALGTVLGASGYKLAYMARGEGCGSLLVCFTGVSWKTLPE